MITYTWTIAKWADRAADATNYVPIDTAIDGAFIDKFGYLSNRVGSVVRLERNPYRIDQSGSTIYKTYSSGTDAVPIIKIVEA